ncbi:DNA repair protein MucB [Bacillus wiedmannii]|uniref:DNA repair protein MucB n=1 Tax=Bacillus wiedmannii TaxID=1890302 RepID=A0A2A8BFR7_9BACI|nr:DNA repair protein MucB [Bacillus wiedmannii]PGA93922.1 DNA repair protein MucB [Bacillus wiedmannii]
MYEYSLLPNRKICFVDLKSFNASVSCVKRGLDPRYTKLAVVGDVNRSGSIVLAATAPLRALGVRKLARTYEIPKRSDIIVVNPNIETYIKCSNYITSLALQYVAPEDFFQYSIVEFAMELDSSLHLFASTPYEFAVNFQKEIYSKTRLESKIGIGPNILMSKLAQGLESKKNETGIAQWGYEDIPTKLWPIRPLIKFGGISHKTEVILNQKGIYTIGDLASYPLHYLKKSFGKMGEEYHLHSNGIDFSRISEKYVPATTSVGKSQILLRNYNIDEFLIILGVPPHCYQANKKKYS